MRTFLFFLGFIVFGLILFFLIGNSLFNPSLLKSMGSWAWLAAVGLMVADIAVPIPLTLIITFMGQTYGPLLGGAIGTLGSFLAGVVAYGLSRMLGRRFARWLLGDELEATARFFANRGAFAVACSRWLPLVPEAVSCMAGLTRMPFGKYCLALLCGAVPMSFSYAALALISENETIPLVVSIVLPVPIWWIAGRLLRGRTAGNSESPNDSAA